MAFKMTVICNDDALHDAWPSLESAMAGIGFNGSVSEFKRKLLDREPICGHRLSSPELDAAITQQCQKLIDTIFTYENTIDKPRQERFTMPSPRSGIAVLRRSATLPELKQVADKCGEWLDYIDEVDAFAPFLYDETENHVGTYLKVSPIGQLYRAAGFADEPFFYTYRHLRDALTPETTYTPLTKHPHGLSIDTVRRLPELLEHPVALMDSDRRDTMVAVLCGVDKKGFPLIAAIRPGGTATYQHRALPATIVCSFYGKPETYFRHKMLERPGRLIYHDIEKGRELDALSKLQLFGGNIAVHDPTNTIIHRPECIVNLERGKKRPGVNDISRESGAMGRDRNREHQRHARGGNDNR